MARPQKIVIQDNDGHRYFGPAAWGSKPFMATPVGLICSHCSGPFTRHDYGMTSYCALESGLCCTAMHRECMFRLVVGSVGHQLELCYCHGGDMEDPPGISLREAARMALELSQRRYQLQDRGMDGAEITRRLRAKYEQWRREIV